MAYLGTARVGTGFNDIMSSMYATRASAFREQVDNAYSASATTCDISLRSGVELGTATRGNAHFLVVHTDTHMDVAHALDIAHANAAHTYGGVPIDQCVR
jgi:hypothetical protein